MTTARTRKFAQVDVFTSTPYFGNPVAVVIDGDGISDESMERFANWTNLSETTFILPPTTSDADYRLRIFTPTNELPFAGHPTLGSAHAWLQAGGIPSNKDVIVQECVGGLINLKQDGDVLSFRAPDLLRFGPIEGDHLDRIARALRISRDEIVAHQWIDNGPGWAGVLLDDAQAVLDLEPDMDAMSTLMLGVVGPYPPGSEHDYEVRGFAGAVGVPEDPVTGSANAGIAQWLIGKGVAPNSYTATQGRLVGRNGTISATKQDDGIWIGGSSRTCIEGSVLL